MWPALRINHTFYRKAGACRSAVFVSGPFLGPGGTVPHIVRLEEANERAMRCCVLILVFPPLLFLPQALPADPLSSWTPVGRVLATLQCNFCPQIPWASSVALKLEQTLTTQDQCDSRALKGKSQTISLYLQLPLDQESGNQRTEPVECDVGFTKFHVASPTWPHSAPVSLLRSRVFGGFYNFN